ncbi:hypothetical protein AB1Y20_019163 [Prymnesium parvum]|uniref:Uncharacterized protein n=1 Tax=Prymnesium parvum TaxID=97485 RepID=A0AB34JU84_PRYPA
MSTWRNPSASARSPRKKEFATNRLFGRNKPDENERRTKTHQYAPSPAPDIAGPPSPAALPHDMPKRGSVSFWRNLRGSLQAHMPNEGGESPRRRSVRKPTPRNQSRRQSRISVRRSSIASIEDVTGRVKLMANRVLHGRRGAVVRKIGIAPPSEATLLEMNKPKESEAQVAMKKQLIEMEKAAERMKRKMTCLDDAVDAAQEGMDEMKGWVHHMLEDFKLLPKKPMWQQAILHMCEYAAGIRVSADQPLPTVSPVAEEVLEQLRRGEPNILPHSSVLAMVHDAQSSELQVIAATPEAASQSARAKKGALWNSASKNALSMEFFQVLREGKPMLRSPHGTNPLARSLVPLNDREGRCFGVLMSGAPALPDEFVEAMGRTAGPMLERVWKWSKVNAMMVVACTWVRKLSDRVASVEWREGVRIKKESGFNWQPLFHHTGDDMKKFQLELRWSDGVPLGVFQVKISEYHDISHGMMELLHSIAPLLTDTVSDIEKMAVADSVPAMQDFGTAYDNARMLLPRKLQSQMKQQLAELNSYQIVSELKGYNEVSEDTFKLMLGVLCMLGRSRKSFKQWSHVKAQLKAELIADMVALDVRAGKKASEMMKCWAESLRATRGLNLDWLLAGGSFPVQVMTKWLLAIRLVCQVVFAIETESNPALKNTKACEPKKRLSLIPVKDTENTESLGELLQMEGDV